MKTFALHQFSRIAETLRLQISRKFCHKIWNIEQFLVASNDEIAIREVVFNRAFWPTLDRTQSLKL